MQKLLLIFIFTICSFNISANTYYKTGKIYNVNELMNNINKDIEDYCKRNLNDFIRDIRSKNEPNKKNNKYQLKTQNKGHSHSQQSFGNHLLQDRQKVENLDACFNIEKQKFNTIINVYYKKNNEQEFLNCYEDIRNNKSESISDLFSNCLSETRKDQCRDILQLDISPNQKAIKYRDCLM